VVLEADSSGGMPIAPHRTDLTMQSSESDRAAGAEPLTSICRQLVTAAHDDGTGVFGFCGWRMWQAGWLDTRGHTTKWLRQSI